MENSVIICTWNNQDTIKDTLMSIIGAGNFDELIIVDNASTDKTQNILYEFFLDNNKVKVFINDKNYYEGAGVAKAMRLAKGNFIFKCDPDIIVPDNWIDNMKAHLIPEIGVVLAQSGSISSWKHIMWRNRKELEMVQGACFLLPRSTINKCGIWDADIFYGYCERDYALRVRQQNLRIIVAEDVEIKHNQIHTKEWIDKRNEIMKESYIIYLLKWSS